MAVSEYVRAALAVHLSALKPQNKGGMHRDLSTQDKGASHPSSDHAIKAVAHPFSQIAGGKRIWGD